MACKPGATNTSACLNAGQIAALKLIYADDVDANQTFVFARFEVGSELAAASGLFGSQFFPIPAGYYQNFVFNDTSFDITTLTFEDFQFALQLNVGNIRAVNPDITPFINRGGKLITYAGGADQLIPSLYCVFLRLQSINVIDSGIRHEILQHGRRVLEA